MKWKIMVQRGDDILAGPTIVAETAADAQAAAARYASADDCDYARECPILDAWAVQIDEPKAN